MPLHEIDTGTSLNVVSSGSGPGPTLLFLHYWGGSTRTFSSVISHLPPTFQSISVDFRGWGDSSGPQTATGYSILDLAVDIENLIKQLNIHDIILIGHSMGGKVAQLIAGRNQVPGLKGIVLLAPAPPTPLIMPAEMKAQQITAYDNAESAEFVVRNVLTSSSSSSSSYLSNTQIKTLVEDIMKGNKFAKLAWPTYASAEDISAETRKKINVPVLVIAGENDRVEPPERIRKEVVGNIEGGDVAVEMVVIEGSGHLLPVEAPLKVARLIEEFVGKLLLL